MDVINSPSLNAANIVSTIQSNPNIVYFEDSEFKAKFDFGKLVKEIVNKFLNTEKSVSFCSDLTTICSNVVGIFGMEIARSLLYLIGLKTHIKKFIKLDMKIITNYKILLEHIKLLKNYLTNNIEIKEQFYLSNKEFVTGKGYAWRYQIISDQEIINYDSDYKSLKASFFSFMEELIENKIINESDELLFNDFFHFTQTLFNSMYENLIFNTIKITQINDILLNLPILDHGYRGYFIKYFETLRRQVMLVFNPLNIPNSFSEHSIRKFFEIHQINVLTYESFIQQYIDKVRIDCYREISTVISLEEQINIEFEDSFVSEIKDVIFCFFICLAQNIIKNYHYRFNFDISNRIQYEHIYLSVLHSICLFGFLDAEKQCCLDYFMITKNTFKKYHK
jgi:hypothetical protein